MAAVHPYQRVLLANRDILLSELPTEDVISYLESKNVLSYKEGDDIKYGRNQREKRESLLDVLHYKGERGFNEFCKALDEYSPYLAAKMSDKDSEVEQTEKYYNDRNTSSKYSASYSDHEKGYREINGEDFRRNSDRDRDERDSKPSDMRGEPEPHYAQVNKRPRDVDRVADDNRSVSSHHSRHSERGGRGDDYYRKERTPRRGDELNPAEHYILEKQTIHLEKANANQGFGIAVSGGLDNPHYKTGDTSIVVSDIVLGSPAHGLLRDNDIIVQVNDVNVERCYHRDAVMALKDAGTSARLIIKRRKVMPQSALSSNSKGEREHTPSRMEKSYQSATLPDRRSRSSGMPTSTIHLKKPEKEGFGFSMAFRLYVKDVKRKGVAHYGGLQRDHVIQKINGKKTEELSLKEAIDMVRNSQDLDLVVADKKLDRYSSTKSLPSVGKRGYENGLDVERDEEPIDRRRAKSLDRNFIKEQRRSRRPSDGDKDKEDDKKPVFDGFSIEKPDKPAVPSFENEIKPVEVKQDQLRDAPDDMFAKLESDRPTPELITKQEAKVEESLPDIPPRKYSDQDRPQLDEPDKGLQTSWKRLGSHEDRADSDGYEDSRPYVPQPADVTRTAGQMDLSMNDWDQGLSPGRERRKDDHSPGSTPRSQRREKPDYSNDKDVKSIFFRKEGSLGIQIQGGNKVGVFVNAVRENNPAYKQGLRRGDQILMANDIDFKDITREEAVLLLLSLGDEVHLSAKPKMSTYERIKNSPGDSFYIKCHFDYGKMKPDELDMCREDVYHVWDTMYGGMIGSWHAQRVTLNNDETETGIIPNKCRAEQLATVRQVEEDKTPKKAASRSNSLKRPKKKGLIKNQSFSDKLDDESFATTSKEFKLPAYERVSLRSPGFVRPVVLLGPMADITRDKLLQDMPEVFAVPVSKGDGHVHPKTKRRSLSYSRIKGVVDAGKHCILDISPDEVEMLNYAQLYPIVLFVKAQSKAVLKDLRIQHGSSGKNVKKLYDNSVKIDEYYSNLLSTSAIHAGPDDFWYNKVKEEISRQQDRRVWMSEDKFEQNDMEFSVYPSRYSVAHEYDPHGDSPTARSSVSHPADEEIRAESSKEVESAPMLFNGPQVEYPPYRDDRDRPPYDDRDRPPYDDRDRHPYDDRDKPSYDGPGGYRDDRDRPPYDGPGGFRDDRDRPLFDDRDRHPYDDRRDRYDDDRDRLPYDDRRGRYDDDRYGDNDVDRASKPGYMPHGNVVKVLPSSQEPGELRQSLRKTRPTSQDFGDQPPDLHDGDDGRGRDGLRKTDYEPRYEGPNPTELELKYKAESLRKVEPKPDVLNQYDERVGVKVSDLWAIDNELKKERPSQQERVQPIEVVKVENKPDDLDRRLEELERSLPPQTETKPTPYRFETKTRNVIIDTRPGDRPQSVASTRTFPRKSFTTVTHIGSKSEPEVRAQVTDRVESAPTENGFRSLPREYGRRNEPENRAVYRAEVTIPRKESKPERPKSAYGYSTHTYAPKPYGGYQRSSSPPPRPAQPTNYEYKLSKPQTELRREPEPRPGTYRSDYRPKVSDFESYRDDSQIITSDFESLDDDTQVVATARGTFTSEGGVLSSPETGVSIHIPEDAIEHGKEQEIYFKVCKDNNIMPPLDADKGETLLSPLVMCGPHGTQFLKPVELRLPHCASMTPDGWSFALKSSDTPSGMPTTWKNVSLPGQENKDKCQVDPNSVSVLVDHF